MLSFLTFNFSLIFIGFITLWSSSCSFDFLSCYKTVFFFALFCYFLVLQFHSNVESVEFQIFFIFSFLASSTRMRGIVPDDILDALKKKKLGLPGIDIEVQEERNAMQMGEFEVIKELLAAHPAAKVAKAQVKKIINLKIVSFQ